MLLHACEYVSAARTRRSWCWRCTAGTHVARDLPPRVRAQGDSLRRTPPNRTTCGREQWGGQGGLFRGHLTLSSLSRLQRAVRKERRLHAKTQTRRVRRAPCACLAASDVCALPRPRRTRTKRAVLRACYVCMYVLDTNTLAQTHCKSCKPQHCCSVNRKHRNLRGVICHVTQQQLAPDINTRLPR